MNTQGMALNKDSISTYIKAKLENIQVFHTDRGNEFENQLIDGTLDTFHIKRSLSKRR